MSSQMIVEVLVVSQYRFLDNDCRLQKLLCL